MRRLQSRIDKTSDNYQTYRAHNLDLLAELKRKSEAARHDRPARDLARLEKQNKMRVHERIAHLLDPGTPFLEFSTLAGNMAYDGEAPQASIVTGLGMVSGREVVIHADDSSVKGGAWYPLSVKKINFSDVFELLVEILIQYFVSL